MPEHLPAPENLNESLLARLERIAAEYRVGKISTWDPEFAAAASEKLLLEEREKTPEQVRSLLLNRYVDAFYPPEEFPQSRLWADEITAPLELNGFQESVFRDLSLAGSVSEVDTEPSKRQLFEVRHDDVEIRLYGPDILVNLAHSGFWLRLPSEKVRAIASPYFSCCQAVLGKNRSGDLCMAHIPGPGTWSAQSHIKGLLEKFGPGKYFFVAPERIYLPGTDEERVKMANRTNLAFREIAEQNDLNFLQYPEIFPGEQSSHPDVAQEFIMLVTANGLQIKQTERQRPYGRRFEETIYNRVLAEKPLHDVDF